MKQLPQIRPMAKFGEKAKIPNIGTKNALLKVLLGQTFEELMSYLKSATSNFSNCKVLQKNKNA